MELKRLDNKGQAGGGILAFLSGATGLAVFILAVGVIIGVGVLGLNAIGISPFGWLGFGGVTQVIGGVTQTTITAAGGDFISDNLGDAATITFAGYDMQANSPFAAVTTVEYTITRSNADGTETLMGNASSTATWTTSVVGDVINVYPRGTGFYGTPLKNYKVGASGNAAETINLEYHTIEAEAGMMTTCYDTEGNEFGVGNTTVWDYNVTMGADQDKRVTCKVESNSTNGARDIKTVCLGYVNDIDKLEILDSGWTKDIRSKNVSDTSIGTIATQYDDCFTWKKGTNEVIRLIEWESHTISFRISSSGTDPATVIGATTDADVGFFKVFDAQYAVGLDGKVYYDYYAHDYDEGDVGAAEDEAAVVGRSLGIILGGV